MAKTLWPQIVEQNSSDHFSLTVALCVLTHLLQMAGCSLVQPDNFQRHGIRVEIGSYMSVSMFWAVRGVG